MPGFYLIKPSQQSCEIHHFLYFAGEETEVGDIRQPEYGLDGSVPLSPPCSLQGVPHQTRKTLKPLPALLPEKSQCSRELAGSDGRLPRASWPSQVPPCLQCHTCAFFFEIESNILFHEVVGVMDV